MKDSIEVSKVHAYIDGVVQGLVISAIGRETAIQSFIEACTEINPELGAFAQRQASSHLDALFDATAKTLEVIYYTP